MPKQHCVLLTETQRRALQALLAAGTAPARKLAHARILLKADQGPAGPAWTDTRIAEATELSVLTVARVRKRFVVEGLDAALTHRPPARSRPRRLDGAQEAHLVAVVWSAPPTGQARWTLRLLADRLVELEIAEAVSYQTVRRTLKTKRTAALADGALVHPRPGQRRVRRPDGGHPQCLRATL